jgi:hypothetical protein
MFVVQFHLRGSGVPTEAVLSTVPDPTADDVWPDEYRVTERETLDPDATAPVPVVSGHIPCPTQGAAESYYDDLIGVSGAIEGADRGYIHVHECPTGGADSDDDVWDCSDRVIVSQSAQVESGLLTRLSESGRDAVRRVYRGARNRVVGIDVFDRS